MKNKKLVKAWTEKNHINHDYVVTAIKKQTHSNILLVVLGLIWSLLMAMVFSSTYSEYASIPVMATGIMFGIVSFIILKIILSGMLSVIIPSMYLSNIDKKMIRSLNNDINRLKTFFKCDFKDKKISTVHPEMSLYGDNYKGLTGGKTLTEIQMSEAAYCVWICMRDKAVWIMNQQATEKSLQLEKNLFEEEKKEIRTMIVFAKRFGLIPEDIELKNIFSP